MSYVLPGARLEAAIASVVKAHGEIPYTCDEETFVVWQAADEAAAMSASDEVLRMHARYRVVIYSYGSYEAIKIRLYAALLANGFALAGMPGEIYNETTQRRQWPIDVEISYDLIAALDAIAQEEKKA